MRALPLFASILFLCGTVTNSAFAGGYQATSAVTAASPTVAPAQSNAPAAAAEQPGAYHLGPGDKIRVIVYGETDLGGEFTVSSAGTVSLPLIGDTAAAGLTATALQQSIQSALSPNYLKDARVNVEILTFRPFYILGEVNKPGQYPFVSGMTIDQAVAEAGGYTYRANHKAFFLKHEGEQTESSVKGVDDFKVAPGDVIRVPERYF